LPSDEDAARRKQRTKRKEFSIDSFAWSPDGGSIVSAPINPDLIQV